MTQGSKAAWTPPPIINFDNIAAVMARLRAPFNPNLVEWRVGATNQDKTRGQALAYIDARVVRGRLNMVLGEWNWQSEPQVQGNQVIFRVAIRINGEWVWKGDGAYAGNLYTSNSKIDPKEEQRLDMDGKGAFSAAFKRTAVSWGVGEYLYDLASPFVDLDERKRFTKGAMDGLFRIAEEPFIKAREEMARRMAEESAGAALASGTAPKAKGAASGQTTPQAATGTSPSSNAALRVAEIILKLEQAESGDIVIDAVEDLQKLRLQDEKLKEQAWSALTKNASRLGVPPEALKKQRPRAA